MVPMCTGPEVAHLTSYHKGFLEKRFNVTGITLNVNLVTACGSTAMTVKVITGNDYLLTGNWKKEGI